MLEVAEQAMANYYDKLLENAKADAPLISLAFECQMFDEIPMQSHDIFMDKVVTESNVYDELAARVETKQVTNLTDLVDDTYAEGFEVSTANLITARDNKWLRHCVSAVTDHTRHHHVRLRGRCQWISQEQAASGMTPDGRRGRSYSSMCRDLSKSREAPRKSDARQNQPEHPYVPTAKCFNHLDMSPTSNWVVKLHCLETVINSRRTTWRERLGDPDPRR